MHGLKQKHNIYLLIIILTGLLAGACPLVVQAMDPAEAVQTFLQALAERDLNRVIRRLLRRVGSAARLEFNSFTAVKLALEDIACQPSGQDGEFTRVKRTADHRQLWR